MIFDILLIIAGVAMVLYGADRLTEGASALARRMNVPEIIIGLTIVAAGTSAPELFVSMVSALKGTPDMAIGNVVGSNTMNAMLIVGCAAMVAPMTISKSTVRKDIPFSVFASVLLVLLSLNSFLGRLDGIFLLAGFALFMYYTLSQAKVGETASVSEVKSVKPTSLPELATSVVAARKGQSAIAIGNVIGSNVFNILLILGLTATISPMQIQGVTLVDMGMMLGSVSLVWLFSYTRYTVERWEGALLVIGYLVYLAWLLSNV